MLFSSVRHLFTTKQSNRTRAEKKLIKKEEKKENNLSASAEMVPMNLEELFDDSRITAWDWTLLLMVFYAPIGIVLLLVRVFALIQFYLMFIYIPYQPIRRYLLKLSGSVLGVFFSEKHSGKAPTIPESAVWVSNHCSPIDWIILQVVANKRQSISFPEGETTNGRAGLLKFQAKALEQYKHNNPNLVAQPIALKVSRPFPAFAVTLLDTPMWTDVFFLLFCPCTTFRVKFLEPIPIREDEELEDYVRRLEQAIAEDLSIGVTSFTAKDKEELVKRKRTEAQQQAPTPSTRRPGNRLQIMASQVKEVLPHVPMATILSDLSRTNSVDATVANLVEGVVPFTPEPVAPPVQASSAVSQPEISSSSPVSSPARPSGQSLQQVSSSTFGKSVQERGLSLQERKQRLLREAQLRYCERHGLSIPGINC